MSPQQDNVPVVNNPPAANNEPPANVPALNGASGVVDPASVPGQIAGPAGPSFSPTSVPGTLNNNALGSSTGGAPTSTSATTTQSHISIPALAPAGAIFVTEPPAAVGTSLYKIAPTGNPLNASANFITFGWNITSVIVQPTRLTVQAACENGYTYPVGSATDGNSNATAIATGDSGDSNFAYGVVPASQSQVVWDVVGYQTDHPETPLPQGLCTLQIADDRGFSAARRAGYLSPNTAAVTFALYTGEAYTPLASGWECLQCNTNSISSSYDAHPIAISLIVAFVVCFLSGAKILFRANVRRIGPPAPDPSLSPPPCYTFRGRALPGLGIDLTSPAAHGLDAST